MYVACTLRAKHNTQNGLTVLLQWHTIWQTTFETTLTVQCRNVIVALSATLPRIYFTLSGVGILLYFMSKCLILFGALFRMSWVSLKVWHNGLYDARQCYMTYNIVSFKCCGIFTFLIFFSIIYTSTLDIQKWHNYYDNAIWQYIVKLSCYSHVSTVCLIINNGEVIRYTSSPATEGLQVELYQWAHCP